MKYSLISLYLISMLVFTGMFAVEDRIESQEDWTFDSEAIDTYLEDAMQAVAIPGLALGIVRDGETIYLQGYGEAAPGLAATPQSPFHIGSVGKTFTALAIMQLANQGRLRLEDPLKQHLPEFTTADGDETAWQITILDLLNHRSGYSKADGVHPQAYDPQKTLDELVDWIRTRHLTYPVGEVNEYSNLNFVLLGAVVERLSEQRYETYTRENIFRPLEMSNVYFSPEEAELNGAAEGHFIFFGVPVAHSDEWVPAHIPAGYVYASAEDMTHYLLAYLAGGLYNGERIVQPVISPRYANKPGRFDQYWQWIPDPAGVCTGHEGGTNTFNAQLLICPGDNIGIILLANSRPQSVTPDAPSANTLANGVLAILRGTTPVPVTDDPLQRYYAVFYRNSAAILLPALFELISSLIGWPRWLLKKSRVRNWIFFGLLGLDGLLALTALAGFPVFYRASWKVLVVDNLFDTAVVVFTVGMLFLIAFGAKVLLARRWMKKKQANGLLI